MAALSEEKRTGLVAALTATGTGRGALESLKAFSDETLVSAVKELERLFAVLDKSGYRDKVRFDLSLLNALDYYNGIIFQGYVKKVPHSVLSGGRYDRLIAKFCPGGIGATGFAIYLSELNAYYSGGEGITDALLIYKDGDDPYLVEKKAAKLRETGLSVRVEKAPADGVKAKTVIKFEV